MIVLQRNSVQKLSIIIYICSNLKILKVIIRYFVYHNLWGTLVFIVHCPIFFQIRSQNSDQTLERLNKTVIPRFKFDVLIFPPSQVLLQSFSSFLILPDNIESFYLKHLMYEVLEFQKKILVLISFTLTSKGPPFSCNRQF